MFVNLFDVCVDEELDKQNGECDVKEESQIQVAHALLASKSTICSFIRKWCF
jgi:hypothetical protein